MITPSRSIGPAIDQQHRAPATVTAKKKEREKYRGKDFETRAQERRLKLLDLHKQAEGRVRSKAVEEDEQRRQRDLRDMREAASHLEVSRKAREDAKAMQHSVRARVEQEREELKAKGDRAVSFRRKQLLIQRGWSPWIELMELSMINHAKARSFFNDCIVRRCWLSLMSYWKMVKLERYRLEQRVTMLASAHYKRQLTRRMYRHWKLTHKMVKAKAKAVSGHFSGFAHCKRAMHGWKVAFERSKRRAAHMLYKAVPIGNRCVMSYCWGRWQRYLEGRRFDREVECRADSTWMALQNYINKK